MKAVHQIDVEIFVIDNNSNDGSKDFFRQKFDKVKFIWNEKNDGFAKANNTCLALATGEYILFLNPDTIVPEDCFKKCIAFLQENKKAGALGVRMIDGSGNFLQESKRSFPSPLTSMYKLTGITKLFPHSKTFAKYQLGNLDENTNHEVEVLSGAFMMVKRVIAKELKGFDELFFMYGEDIDLSYRVNKAGYKNFYFSDTTIIHFKGESTKKNSSKYIKVFYKAMSIFVKKHYRNEKSGLFNFFIQSAISVRAGISILMLFTKRVFIKLKVANKNENKKTLIIATPADYSIVCKLLKSEIAGRIKLSENDKAESIGSLGNITSVLSAHSIKKIILCQGEELSFKQVIELVKTIPRYIEKGFFSSCNSVVIEKNYKDK